MVVSCFFYSPIMLRRLGMDAYVIKPFNPEDLHEMISKILEESTVEVRRE